MACVFYGMPALLKIETFSYYTLETEVIEDILSIVLTNQ
jgi:hypothetical protein